MSSPFIIPIFIAHQGCPHQCLFCNQHSITGSNGVADAVQVRQEIETALAWPRRNRSAAVQVAFYGGSFTGLPREKQEELLAAVQPFIAQGLVREIRLSTRPDYVDGQTPAFLQRYHVKLVELGAQSLDDRVLAASGRGHTAAHIRTAFACLREHGLAVGLQLMVGLPEDSTLRCLASARQAAELDPDLVRIYPCLVIRGSGLERLYRAGQYAPLSRNKALALTGRMKDIFAAGSIPVIRMGLQHSPSLMESLAAGPYHPSFGELVLSRLLFREVRAKLAAVRQMPGAKTLLLSRADESLLRGKENCNIRRLADLGLLAGVEIVFSAKLPRRTVMVRTVFT